MEWLDFRVRTYEAVWICKKCEQGPIQLDRLDYFMDFEACPAFKSGTPARRTLQLRTSQAAFATDPSYPAKLRLVVEAELLETEPWDRVRDACNLD